MYQVLIAFKNKLWKLIKQTVMSGASKITLTINSGKVFSYLKHLDEKKIASKSMILFMYHC